MNEPLFKNSFIRDEIILREFYKHNYLTATRFRIIYIGYIIMVFLSLFSLDLSFFISYLLLGVVLALILMFSYRQNIKTIIAREKEMANGREMRVELEVYDDRIEHTLLETTNTLYFDNIKCVAQTKNSYFIITKAKLVYIFKKDSFTLGNSEKFIEFLKNKGVKIQK